MEQAKKPVAVVLLQFGGPDSLDAVEPFLYNLFSDPDIFQLPFGSRFQKRFAKYLSKSRAKVVREEYEEMGGKSPIVERTNEQLEALQEFLDNKLGAGTTQVVLAMRYWKPFTEEAVIFLRDAGFEDAVLLPLYAQYSSVNAGSSFNEWDRVKGLLNVKLNERRIIEFRRQPTYISSVNARIDEAMAKFDDPTKVFLLFSAHGIPTDLVYAGDPYPQHIRDSMEAVMDARGRKNPYTLSYQSKVGPKDWLTPSTETKVEELAEEGVTDLLLIPIAFVSDHIETVQELDVELREEAEEFGIKNFAVAEGLNSHPLFIQALGELVLDELKVLRPELLA
jgi:ferrochelatase